MDPVLVGVNLLLQNSVPWAFPALEVSKLFQAMWKLLWHLFLFGFFWTWSDCFFQWCDKMTSTPGRFLTLVFGSPSIFFGSLLTRSLCWVGPVSFRFVCVAFWAPVSGFHCLSWALMLLFPLGTDGVSVFYEAELLQAGGGWALEQCQQGGGMHCYLACCSLIWVVPMWARVSWGPTWHLQIIKSHLMCLP